jgi:hypothetical protein
MIFYIKYLFNDDTTFFRYTYFFHVKKSVKLIFEYASNKFTSRYYWNNKELLYENMRRKNYGSEYF